METTEAPVTHRLRNYYRFWRSMESTDGTSYSDSLEDLGLCRTVEDFWRIYLSLPKIGTGNATHYYLFKNKIEPTWEHERNRKGGRITVSIYKKELAPYMWELLLLTTIGEQFDVGSEICGISVSVKRWNCVFSVWNHTATFEQAINKIEMKLKSLWKIPHSYRFRYKVNSVAVNKIPKQVSNLSKQENADEILRKRSTNRFADLSDSDGEE